LISDMVDGGHG